MHSALFALIVAGRVWSGDAPAARAVVLLDGDAAPSPPRTARVDEVWLSFSPKVQVVAPGSTLLFRDRDDESHTVHAWYRGHTLFNRASVPKGEEQRLTLEAPGVVTLTCDLHPEMRAFVVVSSSPLSAVTDFDGRFSVEAPPGRYRAHVWRWQADDGNGPPTGRDAGELTAGGPPVELKLPPLPPRLYADEPAAAAAGTNHGHDRRSQLPAWMRRIGDGPAWPRGLWVFVLAALAIPLGILGAVGNLRLAARRGWTPLTAILLGCLLAFSSGALVIVGLHGAVATALGFGAFIGTAIFGAANA